MAFVKELKILLSNKEVDKNHLWLRPKKECQGFDLLIYNVNGWEPLFLSNNYIYSKVECPVCEINKN